MATLFPPPQAAAIHTSPRDKAMASRRIPLGNLPNATNSPFREAVQPGMKRPRTDAFEKQPPAKKQAIELKGVENRSQTVGRKLLAASTKQHNGATASTATVPSNGVMNTATRKTKTASAVAKTQENLSEIRQWQRHYKKLFPTMTFYYDSVPDETRHKIGKQIQLLGSREEVFFSKTVTHVVTTRSVPNEASSSSSTGRSPLKTGRDGTVDPSQLKKKTNLHHNDILIRAKEMGIKVWGLEKLQRMLTTMFNAETGEAPVAAYHSRNTSTAQNKTGQQAHLGQMLQKEKEYGQAQMDWATDMAAFRGYYVYVHDMDELTKPTIVRDYSKPATKEQGKWPQLRVTAPGRCPFIEDPNARYERAAPPPPPAEKAPRTRAAAARANTPAIGEQERAVLAENNNMAQRRHRSVSAQPDDKKPSMDPPKMVPVRGTSTDNLPLFGSAQASLRQHPRFAGGEPIASGVQPSNVTSAIRSQMISSTAAAPGGKAGTSKELNRLSRQVLQRNSVANPYLNNDLRTAINNGGPGRGQKRKATDPLANIKEEDDNAEAPRAVKTQSAPAPARKKKAVEKELKPGYCENCRAKFADFDEHVLSRTHRKFAMDDQNWKELDDLLSQLGRPLKNE